MGIRRLEDFLGRGGVRAARAGNGGASRTGREWERWERWGGGNYGSGESGGSGGNYGSGGVLAARVENLRGTRRNLEGAEFWRVRAAQAKNGSGGNGR